MRQKEAARSLGLSRSAIVQIEAGRRAVSSLELDRLAYLYGRQVGDFLAEGFRKEDTLVALFRLHPELAEDGAALEAARRSLQLGRAISGLESVLGMDSESVAPPSYQLASPKSKWNAVRQGEQVASEERRRLGLGVVPLPDMVELLEAQGIRTAQERLPSGVSGLTLAEPRVGSFIVVNSTDAAWKQRFSFAHEYAHVLLDRPKPGILSRTQDRETLPEVRANVFAANFLMPGRGVELFIANLAKGRASRDHSEVFDEEGVQRTEDRPAPGSQEIQIYDVARLSHHFGVSGMTAVYRLRNLRLISQPTMERLLEQENQELGRRIAGLLGLTAPDPQKGARAFQRRFLALGIEALRREAISRGKLRELARLVDTDEESLEQILEDVGLGQPPVDVELGAS